MSDELIKKITITENNEYLSYLTEFNKELENSSDRGIALICGSIIDQLLTNILKSFLVETDKRDSELFKGNGPLSDFDSKIKMTYYLGLISKNEVSNLTYLQRVRNRFAHQIVNISFENNDIANICKNFSLPKNGYLPTNIPFSDKQTGELPTVELNPVKRETSAKDRFIYTFQYLYVNLGNRIIENLGKRTEYDVIHTADMTISTTIKTYEEGLEKYELLLKERNNLVDKLKGKVETLKKQENSNANEIVQLEEEIAKIKEGIDTGNKDYEIFKTFFDKMIKIYKYSYDVVKNSMID
ncbi:MltR family transcriptional regulator [Neobacillus sp. LXY-1]|uniref:MltR family transcriptional regulator n=1 Tax=Neobacillus sp. LXY-1 TaxID=3379133 RepID=UPI003EDEFB93